MDKKLGRPLLHLVRSPRRLAGVTASRPLRIERSNPHKASYTAWSPVPGLDEWVEREARPVSLRQLTVFGRSLSEDRLLSGANYVRTELPTRIAHRLRDMQTLPYIVLTNPNMAYVYDAYCNAFDVFRRIKPIKTPEDNVKFCETVSKMLEAHLGVIPKLVMGVLESRDTMEPGATDRFMNNMLRSRISRRVICEQHLALTSTFHSQSRSDLAKSQDPNQNGFIGQVFLRCNAKDVVEKCALTIQTLCRETCGTGTPIPEINIVGHLDATLTYIPSHLEYIVGELLRNSVLAVIERRDYLFTQPPPIEVLICESPQHVIFRVSDQGGGIPQNVLPSLYSFVKGPHRLTKLENMNKVPELAATLQDLKVGTIVGDHRESSLSTLSGRPPNLRLGIGLPMSRVYAEFWAGSLEVHSLEGYGVDAFLQISKLGNKNEQLSTRKSVDAL